MTLAAEPVFRKQEAAKSGQTCAPQSGATLRTSSLSALANAVISPASKVGANPGKAITAALESAKIAKAAADLTILNC